MKCDICGKREAVLFVQQVMGTVSTEIHLCQSCARKRGIEPSGSGVDLSLSSLFGELLKAPSGEAGKKTCPRCGLEAADFKKHGMLGCPDCYSVFHADIVKYVRSRSPDIEYSGRLPKRLKELRYVVVERQQLKDRLQRALADEDYETAASVRDELSRLDAGTIGEAHAEHEE
jgi:protein arginine kinase activator